MKKLYVLLTLSLSFSFAGFAQNGPTEGPGYYFNGFQHYRTKNVDSALYFIRLLASDKKYLPTLEDLLHNSFAQSFIKRTDSDFVNEAQKQYYLKDVETARILLPAMMADKNAGLKKAVQPVYYWARVQENENNDALLRELVAEFINTQLSTTDMYTNRVGRYALLIHRVIAPKKSLEATANELLKPVITNLKNNQVTGIEGAARPLLIKRAWYRFLYAYSNSVQGKALLAENRIKEAGPYLKTAFEYSPDITDKNVQYSFFYDLFFLTNKEDITFQDEYIDYLTKNSGNKQETLSALMTTALVNTSFKDQLKTFYNNNFPGRESFNDYWIKSINQQAQKAPAVSLKLMDGSQFSSSKQKNKWILLDFWGTWCGPCRREHPDLEKFYKNISTASTGKITLVTIACLDNEKNVSGYMTQNKYSFPVAMSDKRVEKSYNINSYPSKVLISPQGKYLVVPFGIDWVDFVKKYADL
ncbi:TlpA family protein disulfide reductase [Niastella populi]|nr:TlpA disulfide reductase family protein [Niastella populi]